MRNLNIVPSSNYRQWYQIKEFWISGRKRILSSMRLCAHRNSVKFETKSTQRFLIQLIFHHGFVLRTNGFGDYFESPVEIPEASTAHDKKYKKCLFLLTSYFNHSCVANIIKLDKGNLAVSKAILPIKSGEQLFFTYIDEVFNTTEKQRNDQLEK